MSRKGTIQSEYSINLIEPAPELLEIQNLMPVDKDDRNNLKDDIEKHGIREALKGYKEGRKFFVLAGFTRLQIAKELNFQYVPIEILNELPEEERSNFAIDDNLNRRHLTTKQKQALIDRELKRNPSQSNRQVGEKLQTDHKTVSTRRRKLETTGEIPQLEETTGKDGKARKIDRKQPKPTKTDQKSANSGRQTDTIDSVLNDCYYKIRKMDSSSKDRQKAIKEIGNILIQILNKDENSKTKIREYKKEILRVIESYDY